MEILCGLEVSFLFFCEQFLLYFMNSLTWILLCSVDLLGGRDGGDMAKGCHAADRSTTALVVATV